MSKEEPVRLSLSGSLILNTPLLNKGTAFTPEEREALGLNGLLPTHVSTVEEQIDRCYQNYSKKRTPLGKYSFLIGILSRNEHLFYQFVSRHAAEMLPIIYTPTVGEAAVQYSSIYFHQRGLYISYPLMDKMEEIFENCPQKEIDVIVVTDGERILGLGDQGIGGMTIPVGKLSLYTLFGGIHPARTLPILLDVGTNNPYLLKDNLYLGLKHPRITGEEYDEFVGRFIEAVKKLYPNALLQWEDFGKNNARRLLDKYRKKILSFNDDIQGTAAVVLSGLLAAVGEVKQKISEQKVAILGGGSAGTGIADLFVKAMREEGLSEEEAYSRIYIIDVDGLIHFNSQHLGDALLPYQKTQNQLKSWKIANSNHISFQETIKNGKITVLIGVCAQTGAFTKEIIQEMSLHTQRPIVFPLSNPTSKAECTPQELIEWTDGKAIVATGSPFQPVQHRGKTYKIGQCNNVYIFPGVGLGALAARAKEVTDGMFLEAARALASFSPALKNPAESLFPRIEEVREVSRQIAVRVAQKAASEGISSATAEIEKNIQSLVWEPHYPKYIN
ncbi:MAG: NAD-dependent malic enzyme [Chlamydiae bacterium RIFCSPHIGHO2_12_FULL_49_9]|nr:MAG: NAD-dependent malic enzyme [Chlamydiae bacterium RIFCSPHIGHO2_12_FULL_49_9]